MKKFLLFASLVLFSTSVFAAGSEQALQKLISLQGTWEGQYKDQPIRLTYQPISGGAALLETMEWVADKSSMTTIYHPYGNQMMATHYCKMKNQPRMVASIPEGDIQLLEFQFLDGTNLGNMYTSGIAFRFIDADTLEQTVKFEGHSEVATVVYRRKE